MGLHVPHTGQEAGKRAVLFQTPVSSVNADVVLPRRKQRVRAGGDGNGPVPVTFISVTLRGEHAADMSRYGLNNTAPKHVRQKLRETQNRTINKPAPRNGCC